MATEITQKNMKYNCEKCCFYTNNKNDYRRHITTTKHKNNIGLLKKTQTHNCELCNKTFNDRSGLWRHKKKCNDVTYISTNTIPDNRLSDITDENKHIHDITNTHMNKDMIILELLKQNTEFQKLMVKETTELRNIISEQNQKMMEMAGNMNNPVNNNTNINSNNKFNLNVFLNEKCKNAMSLKDFVKSINISIQDFIETGERGFIDGISNIIVERINDMEIHDRPLHCTDLKRETVYIKDEDKWEKDTDKEKLRKAVKGVAYKNERMRPIWYDSTPDVGIMGTDNYEKFFKYSEAALVGCGKEETKLFEDKIMKNIMKEATIDKNVSMIN